MSKSAVEVIYRGNILLREWRVVGQENGQAARLQPPVQIGQTGSHTSISEQHNKIGIEISLRDAYEMFICEKLCGCNLS